MKKSFSPLFYVLTMMMVLMGFYTLERGIYFLWNQHGFLESHGIDIFTAFIFGLRFDIYALIFINAIPILLSIVTFQKIQSRQIDLLKYLILILNVPFIAINQIDMEFSNFVGRRMTFGSLHIIGEAQGKITAFITTYGLIMLLQALILILFGYFTLKIAAYFKENPTYLKPLNYAVVVVILFPLLALGGRGGLQRKPLSPTHAIVFEQGYLNELILNSSFTMLRSRVSSLVPEKKYFKDFSELKPFLNGTDTQESRWTKNLSQGLDGKKTNVVIIIFESLSLDYMEFTPFLNELSKKGLFLTNNYANGRRSIEAISSILAGLPALMPDSYVHSPYFNNELKGVGTYFKKEGYQTAFFHGGLPGTMFFDIFTKKAGFDRYFSSDDYPDQRDSDGFWGIFDEPFLQFTLSEMDKIQKPFLGGIFTLTSHHPYKIPDKYKDKMPKGSIPILQAVYYSDYSLKKFFEAAAAKPWFKNTLFIITADHTSLPYKPELDTTLGRFRIPMIFYHPSITEWPKIDSKKLTQQADILPTLLDMFKIKDPNRALFGKSIFNDKDPQVVLLNDQTYYIVRDNLAMELRPSFPIETFNISKTLKLNTSVANDPILEKRLKATIQYFDNSMIHNSLYTY